MSDDRITPWAGLRYGALGAPLAFAALPLYVLLPNHYAAQLGVPLAGLGAVLLGSRALDALIDPALGRWVDHGLAQPRQRVLGWAWLAALLMALGFAALFFPPAGSSRQLLAWCAAALLLTSLGYSALGVLHQAWGARLGGTAAQQARIVSWREGMALAGVLGASVLPALAGIPLMVATCVLLLVLGLWALRFAPFRSAPPRLLHPASAGGWRSWALPWRVDAFRRLMQVFVLNGVASAIPATLLLFFIRDRLQASSFEPLFLASYFAAGALSIPLWVRAVRWWGLERAWLVSMGLAIAVFSGATTLGAGDVVAYTVVCTLSGIALGADLTLPSAILAGVIQRAGHGEQSEGAYFGWWNFATKLNLALAAGVALPALSWFGYAPGSDSPQALSALTTAYCLLPCVLKAGAAVLLYTLLIHNARKTP